MGGDKLRLIVQVAGLQVFGHCLGGMMQAVHVSAAPFSALG